MMDPQERLFLQTVWEALEDAGYTKEQLQEICKQYEVFLSIDLTATNVQKILTTIQPLGISVKGGVEEKVGFKSYDELDKIFEVLEVE